MCGGKLFSAALPSEDKGIYTYYNIVNCLSQVCYILGGRLLGLFCPKLWSISACVSAYVHACVSDPARSQMCYLH